MTASAIVPQKPLALAKSRIAGIVGPATRAGLSLALLDGVCRALRATPGVEEVLVLTTDPAVRDFGRATGIRAVPDMSASFNDALAGALKVEAYKGRAALVVSADLPLLRPADVAAVLATGGTATLVLAPSKDGTGTNALLLPPGVRFRPAFGPGSRAKHRDLARELGLSIVEIRRPGLAFDLDTPCDLAALGTAQTFNSLRVPVTI